MATSRHGTQRGRRQTRASVTRPLSSPEVSLMPGPTVLVSAIDRLGLREAVQAVDALASPAFMAHTDLAALWSLIYAEFPETQIALRAPATGAHLAHANAVPFHWNGSESDLPRSAVEMVALALEQRRRGLRANTVGALQ